MAYIRGSNPVWSFVDLQGNQLDDTYYFFILYNTLPYIEAPAWQDPSGSIAWSNPIQFLANGTLPIDIFFDTDIVYRLEVRHGNTQDDPLIYLIENYSPGEGSGDISVDLSTSNQITNPQFSLISFSAPYTQTGAAAQDIEVAPGWQLSLLGSGNVTLDIEPLNDDAATVNPTNAPYALRITTSGSWSSVILKQRFNQNGMLWAEKYVSNVITAKAITVNQVIASRLIDSEGNTLADLIDTTATLEFIEYPGNSGDPLPATQNTDVPPAAWIEYQLILPNTCDILLTSFQLLVGQTGITSTFEQDSIERQVDHTFHYYRESLLFMPKDSVLTGWNFGLNPWQFQNPTQSNVASSIGAAAYRADQTIVIQQNYVAAGVGDNVSTGRAPASQNYGFKVQAVTNKNKFALIQYIDPATARPLWGNALSAVVKVFSQKQTALATLGIKMKLLSRTSLPSTLSQTEPVLSWAEDGEPTFGAGWSPILAQNDPVYYIENGVNELVFNNFVLPASSSDDMTLACVIYTLNPMTESGTPDYLVFNDISLVVNEFAVASNPKTYENTLHDCYRFYETSYLPGGGDVPRATPTEYQGAVLAPMYAESAGGNVNVFPAGFEYRYKAIKALNPVLGFYSPFELTPNRVEAYSIGAAVANNRVVKTANFGAPDATSNSIYSFMFEGFANATMVPAHLGSGNNGSGHILYHFTADARLGVV